MTKAKEGTARPIKKTHLGIIGMITVAIQYGVGLQNENQTKASIQAVMSSQSRAQAAELKAAVEKEFVRKAELNRSFDRLDRKLDTLNTKVSRVEGYLKAKHVDILTVAP